MLYKGGVAPRFNEHQLYYQVTMLFEISTFVAACMCLVLLWRCSWLLAAFKREAIAPNHDGGMHEAVEEAECGGEPSKLVLCVVQPIRTTESEGEEDGAVPDAANAMEPPVPETNHEATCQLVM